MGQATKKRSDLVASNDDALVLNQRKTRYRHRIQREEIQKKILNIVAKANRVVFETANAKKIGNMLFPLNEEECYLTWKRHCNAIADSNINDSKDAVTFFGSITFNNIGYELIGKVRKEKGTFRLYTSQNVIVLTLLRKIIERILLAFTNNNNNNSSRGKVQEFMHVLSNTDSYFRFASEHEANEFKIQFLKMVNCAIQIGNNNSDNYKMDDPVEQYFKDYLKKL